MNRYSSNDDEGSEGDELDNAARFVTCDHCGELFVPTEPQDDSEDILCDACVEDQGG